MSSLAQSLLFKVISLFHSLTAVILYTENCQYQDILLGWFSQCAMEVMSSAITMVRICILKTLLTFDSVFCSVMGGPCQVIPYLSEIRSIVHWFT